MQLRPEIKKKIKRVVIKLGSLCITHEDGGLRQGKIREIAKDIALLKKRGYEVILVSSGAINAGKHLLKKNHTSPDSISEFQASSAIGQPILMHSYQLAFKKQKLNTAQVLVTHDDIKNKHRYFNLKNTLEALIANNLIPIINENDSVSFEEITLGDNDQLAAMICELFEADLLLLLTQVDGLYDSDPSLKSSHPISYIPFQEKPKPLKLFKKSTVGKGGMKTKLQAVRRLTPLGTSVIIASFIPKTPIKRALYSEVGSFFEAANIKLSSRRKSRLLARVRSHASVTIDDGAYTALLRHGSLLPVGIKSVRGPFHRGDVISIKHKNSIFAYGISEYNSKEVFKIKGHKSHEIKTILDFAPSKVAIHRNNLILKEK